MSEIKAIMKSLAAAAFSPECPAQEAFSNQYILRDVFDLIKPDINFILFVGSPHPNSTWIYRVCKNEWSRGLDLPSSCDLLALAWCDGGIVSMNNIQASTIPTNCFSLKLPTFEVDDLSPMTTRSLFPGLAVVDDNLFVFGGFDGQGGVSDTYSVYSIKKKEWELSPLASRRMLCRNNELSTAVIGNKIYLIGGHNYEGCGCQALANFHMLDTKSRTWTVLPPMKCPRSDCGTAVIDERFIMVFGGFSYSPCTMLDSVEMFDTQKNEWSMLPIKTPIPGVQTAIKIHENIVVLSISGAPPENKILCSLNVANMKWSILASPPPDPKRRTSMHCTVGIPAGCDFEKIFPK